MDPIIVDWQITSRCTRKCEFCYGPKTEPELSTKETLKAIEVFKSLGVKVIGITGGEPLTRTDIVEVLKYIKDNGMAICLSTNCDLYIKYRDAVLNYVDALGIPIEGSNKSIHDDLRGKGSFEAVISALRDAYYNGNAKFRIGTVLTNRNYFDLKNIEFILSQFKDKIVYWKLYEFIIYPSKCQNVNLAIIKLRPPEKNMYSVLGKSLGKEKIFFDTLEKRNRSYFLIKPNGDVFIPILNKTPSEEFVVGNILENPEKAKENWNKYIDCKGYIEPHRCIFRKDSQLKCNYLIRR